MIKFYNTVNSLCLYRNILEDPIFKNFKTLIYELGNPDFSYKHVQNIYLKLKSDIATFTIKNNHNYAQTTWENFIVSLILNEESINKTLENDNFPLPEILNIDLSILSEIFNFNFDTLVHNFDPYHINIFSKKLSEKQTYIGSYLSENNTQELIKTLVNLYQEKQLDFIDKNKAFKTVLDDKNVIKPILNSTQKALDDLVGYERQKQKLLTNTRSFINGNGGLNTLLYGDMGTGKSTMVKALLNEFDDTDLRLIDVKKNELESLPEVLNKVSKYPYPFIIFIDDLSFDNGDDSYKILKNYLEGSLENVPENVLLYATSNKRTLVSQSKSEREDAVNAKEILEEKLSLVSRFGLTIQFSVPNQNVYLEIVKALCKRNGIKYDDNVREQAIKWELRHMNRSGRTAEQFVQSLKSELNN